MNKHDLVKSLNHANAAKYGLPWWAKLIRVVKTTARSTWSQAVSA